MITPSIEIYTDGSCHTQYTLGAWASIILYNNEIIELKGEEINTTHNRMELLAVIEAIHFIDNNLCVTPLVIYTDSQYVCRIPERKEKLKEKQFLTNKGTPHQNIDLVQSLIQLIETHTIQFIKVKAHQIAFDKSSKYNAEVDKLARELVRKRVLINHPNQ